MLLPTSRVLKPVLNSKVQRSTSMLDFSHPFFRPTWRRWVVVVLCLGMALFDFLNQNIFWAVVFGGLGSVALWMLFFDQATLKKLNDDQDNLE